MRIPGIVYLIVGLGISIVSSFIEKFTVFLVVGIVFMAIGIGKIIMGIRSGSSDESGEEKKVKKKNKKEIYRFAKCPNCGSFNHVDVNNCRACGGNMGGMIK